MRRIVIAALGLAMAASAAAPSMAQESALKWGYDSEPDQPFVDRGPTGDPTGFDVDLMNAMCAEMKTKCEIAITVWDSMIPALESKKIDIIWTGMGITEEREKVINFTDVYRKSPAAYLYPTGSNLTLTAEGLSGKYIGVQKGTIYETFANKHFGSSANLKLYGSLDDAAADLSAGRIDLVIGTLLQIQSYLKTNHLESELEYRSVGADIIFGTGCGAGVRKSDTDLLNRLNGALRKLIADGTYHKIAAKYVSFDPLKD